MTNLPSQLPHCPLHSTLLSCLGSESSFKATVPPPCRCRTPHVSSDTHDTHLWGCPSCLAGALTSYTMLPPLPGCSLTLPLPSHWALAWMSSLASFWFCHHMPGCPSGVASSSPVRVLTSHAAFLLSPLGRVLVPCVGQPPLAITHLPLLLLPSASCMCLPCSAAPTGFRTEPQEGRAGKEGHWRKRTRNLFQQALWWFVCTCAKVCMRPLV